MECRNCGNDQARAWRFVPSKDGSYEACDHCSDTPIRISIPDVYWRGAGYHPGILDKENRPIFLHSRQHKARIMSEQGLREAGDHYHGTVGTESEKINSVRAQRHIEHKLQVREEAKRLTAGVKRLKATGKI